MLSRNCKIRNFECIVHPLQNVFFYFILLFTHVMKNNSSTLNFSKIVNFPTLTMKCYIIKLIII